MCLVCDFLKDKKITIQEAVKNLMELRTYGAISDNHYHEALETIKEAQKVEDDNKTRSVLKKS